MTDQWFAIFNGATEDLVSVGSAVAFPLTAGLRAVTVDGPQNGRFWDKTKLDFNTTPPGPPDPPPPVKDPMPFREEWGKVDFVFNKQVSLAADVVFDKPFDYPPLIDGITVNVPGRASGSAYLRFTTGMITEKGFQLNAHSPNEVGLNMTVPVVWHAVQRWRDKA